MKILLLGKAGLVGQELRHALPALGQVVALGRDDINLGDQDALLRTLAAHRPEVIVNAAAYTAVDQAETDQDTAARVNTQAVATLAAYAKDTGALLVHYSTDYVFDGDSDQPYTETDAPHPLNVYGLTKLAGESAILASGCDALVFRCSWAYAPHGRNFPATILRLARTRNRLDVVADQVGAPTSAALIAGVTALAIARHGQQPLPGGIYHLAASGATSWHAFAQYVVAGAVARGAALALTPDQVHPIPSKDYPAAAKRPHNSRLDTTRLSDALGLRLPSWTEGADHFLDQLSARGEFT
ncbi:dTDP-4-dehydrorhamnose reductase [Achromobacter marplatensis]|uniref:dTDP-4-dehydrorhamnose reductase n=1 Tax=Achromobacter marplatensis TaxID=470868 RepID=UPI0039F6BFA1